MDFDESRVYTALNADSLKPGSKCFFADDLGALKLRVKDGDCPHVLDKVLSEDYMSRFIAGSLSHVLAYCVEEPVPLKWMDLKIGDTLRNLTTGVIHMVIGMDPNVKAEEHIFMGTAWYSDNALDNWEKVEANDDDR